MDDREIHQRIIAGLTDTWNRRAEGKLGERSPSEDFVSDLLSMKLGINAPVPSGADRALVESTALTVGHQVRDQAGHILACAMAVSMFLAVTVEELYPEIDMQNVLQVVALRVSASEG